MKTNGYEPRPLDVSGVELPEELGALTELLAENAHDVWAERRLLQGWRHGPERDDARRQHPQLVAYADLPESEKDYDRAAVTHTLKAILALGYRISRES